MAKPTDLSPHLRWATAPLIPADVVEPDVTHKDEGWQDAEEPPHSFFNYWMNLVYLWIVYLDNLTAEALTWTAHHTFQAGVSIATGAATALDVIQTAGQDGVLLTGHGNTASKYALHIKTLVADGGGANSVGLFMENDTAGTTAVFGNTSTGKTVLGQGSGSSVLEGQGFNTTNTTDATAAGGVVGQVFGAPSTSWQAGVIGRSQLGGETVGTMGVGMGMNSGSINASRGGRFVGGDQAGAAAAGAGLISTGGNATGTTTAAAGRGGTLTGGDITNGAGNAAGAAGFGARVKGGDITGDTHGRLGGAALDVTGGLGQAGYGPALHADHGDIWLDAGRIVANNNTVAHVLGFTQIDGTLDVVGALTADSDVSVAGNLHVTGSIGDLEVPIAVGGGGGAPVFAGTWVNEGTAGQETLHFQKDKFGYVHIRGQVKSGGTVLIFTLPVGYRPVADILTHSIADFGAGYVGTVMSIRANGNVEASGNHVVIDCSFHP